MKRRRNDDQTHLWQYLKKTTTTSSKDSTNINHDTLLENVNPSMDLKQYTTYTMYGIPVHFPFEAYRSQKQMMSKIIKALREGQNALLESPTGSGKSLALLCATLAWQGNTLTTDPSPSSQNTKNRIPSSLAPVDQSSLILNTLAHPSGSSNSSSNSTFSVTSVPNDDAFEYTVQIDSPSMSLTPPLGCKETPHKGDQCTNLTSLPLLSSTLTSTTPSKRVSKIYYTSRTHKQLTQVIKELKNNTVYRPRMTVLGSRNQYCIHEPVMKSSNRDEACQKQVKEHTCPYYLNVRSLRFCKSLPKVWDIEDLKQMGSTTFGCPYFAARQLVEDALLIFCPYNYLIDPIIRNALEIDLTDCIIIIDEGHNIEDCARDAATCEVTDHELGALYQEFLSLEAYTKNETTDLEDFNAFLSKRDLETDQLRSFLRSLIDFLQNNLFDFQTKDFEKQFKIVPTVELVRFLGLAGFTQEKISLLTKEFKELSDVVQSDHRNQIGNEQPLISQKLLNPLHKILLLLEYLLDPNFTNDFHVVVTKKVSKKLKAMDWDSKLSFLCMNPSIAFSAFKNATSVILTSGTLSPMNSFASELNTRFEITLEADHVLNPGQAWVGVFPQWQGLKLTGTYKSSETFAYQDQIGLALLSILQKVPNGVLMFVPSYSFVEKLVNRWTITGCLEKLQSYKAIFYEHKVQTSFEPLLAEYYDIVDRSVKNEGNGALLIAVYRGKVSEGIDFSDHRARAVICVGIPYPLAFDIQVNLKRDYNDANQHRCQLLSGSDWYNIQGFRALNQALGRCLRHKNDWGALILLEERLQSEWYQKGLSKWVRQRLVVFDNEENGMQSLNNFIQSRIAPCMT